MSGNTHSSNRDYASPNCASSNRTSNFDSDGSPEPVLRLPRKNPSSKKGLYLDKSQLIILWSAIAGMMVFIFVTGFHAGRNQGREALLESVSREAVRLPILASDKTTKIIPQSSEKTKETKFDFAGSVALKNNQNKSSAVTTSAKKATEKSASNAKIASNGIVPGWYIQVEAAKSESELSAIKERFTEGGFTPVVHKGKIRDRVFYQVILGPYQSRDLASDVRKKVKSKELSKIEPFVRKF